MVLVVILASGAAVVQHWSHASDNVRAYNLRLRQAPRTRPLIAKATNGRPMSIKMSGQGFVSKAENTEMVAYSMNKNANQQASAILRPHNAVVAFNREIRIANA